MSASASDPARPYRVVRIGAYEISDDPARLDPVAVQAYLTRSYWSPGIPLDVVRQALSNSLCIGAYGPDGAQVGLVRVITDDATYAYLCDVYVLETHQGSGLGKAMMSFTVEHPRLQGLRTWNLRTRDAHGLYSQFGFSVVDNPEGYMIRRFPDVYKTS